MKESTPSTLDLLKGSPILNNPMWRDFAAEVDKLTKNVIDEQRWKFERINHTSMVQRGDYFDTAHGKGRVSMVRHIISDVDNSYEDSKRVEDYVTIDLGNGLATTVPMRTMPERNIMVQHNAAMGFDFFSDKLSDTDEQRIMRYVAQYWPRSGDQDFVKFISFVKNVRFEVFQLNTPDYGDPDNNIEKDPYLYLERFTPFVEQYTINRKGFDWNKPTPEEGFGGVYPTSHVELEHDAIVNPNPDYIGTVELFYFLAPIHLVLERFVSAVYAPDFHFYQGNSANYDLIDHAMHKFNTDAEIIADSMLTSQYDLWLSGQLVMDASFNNIFPHTRTPSRG